MRKMAEQEFWDLIDTHVKRRRDGGIDVKPLRRVLEKMPPPKILAFGERLSAYYFKSRTWPLWGAAWLIHDGAPDDTFDYFRSWLLGQGREVFMAAMKDPDSLAEVATPEALDDELYCIADTVFESVSGKSGPDSNFKLPKLDKRLDFNDPRAMERAYPRLFQRFGSMYEGAPAAPPPAAPDPADPLLERLRKYAGKDGGWEAKDLAGFFQRYRPDGKGLSEIYAGVEHGRKISNRLSAAMKVDGTTKGLTLSANNLVPVTDQQAVALVKLLCGKIRKLAEELDDDGWAERFVADQFVVRAGKRMRRDNYTAYSIEILCHVAFDLVWDSEAPARVLSRAISALFPGMGHTWVSSPLAYYIQWPVCADRYQTVEPFKPFFDLWRRGVGWRITKDKVAEIFLP